MLKHLKLFILIIAFILLLIATNLEFYTFNNTSIYTHELNYFFFLLLGLLVGIIGVLVKIEGIYYVGIVTYLISVVIISSNFVTFINSLNSNNLVGDFKIGFYLTIITSVLYIFSPLTKLINKKRLL